MKGAFDETASSLVFAFVCACDCGHADSTTTENSIRLLQTAATTTSQPIRLLQATTQMTERQKEVCRLVSAGLTNNEIGKLLGITERTVDFHVACLFDITGMSRRVELAVWYERRTRMDKETQIQKLAELLTLAYDIIGKQEDYVLKLQAELTMHKLEVPKPERE